MSTPTTTISAAATYSGAALAVYGGWTVSEWAMALGGLTTVLGLIVTWVYKQKGLTLERRKLRLQFPEEELKAESK